MKVAPIALAICAALQKGVGFSSVNNNARLLDQCNEIEHLYSERDNHGGVSSLMPDVATVDPHLHNGVQVPQTVADIRNRFNSESSWPKLNSLETEPVGPIDVVEVKDQQNKGAAKSPEIKVEKFDGSGDFHSCYESLGRLGAGNNGQIYFCKDKSTEVIHACKVGKRCVRDEATAMHDLAHPNVVKLIKYFATKSDTFVMELLDETWKTLESYQSTKASKTLTESEAKGIFKQVLDVAIHINSKGFSHRDIHRIPP
jgi:Protein kinase domain